MASIEALIARGPAENNVKDGRARPKGAIRRWPPRRNLSILIAAMNILIVEDDQHLAGSLAKGLKEEGFEAFITPTAREAGARMEADHVDLVILDLGLPDGDGMQLLARLKKMQANLPVIITTARGDLNDKIQGLEAGADDYLVKPYAVAELLARIQVQLRHLQETSVNVLSIGDLVLDVRSRKAKRSGREIELTPREFDLLVYLMEARGRTVSREMLARAVWRAQSRLASLDNVIDVHVSRLREKVDRGHDNQLIHTVRGVGFVLKESA